MFEIRGLTKKYGDHTVVDDVSMDLEPGKIYGFLGPNGAGKSTTMNMITGYLGATSGTVTINGISLEKEPVKAKKLIGYLPEQPPLYGDMTVKEYLDFVFELKGAEGDRDEAVSKISGGLGLDTVSDRLIRNLSKGYKQRVGIAQAMIGDPEVIILDEPTVGLDPAQLKDVRDLIKSLGQDHTVIFSSHILGEVSAVCDYVYVISEGRLVSSGSIDEIGSVSSEAQRLSLKIRGDETAVRLLEQMDGAASVEYIPAGDGISNITLTAEPGKDIRQDVMRYCALNDIALLEITTESGSLEDVFLELTREEGE